MRNYELTVVLPEKTTPAKSKSFEEKIKKLVDSLKGKMGKAENWGERELGYKMKKSNSGTFLYFELELNPEAAHEIEIKLKVDDGVLRHLLVKKE